MRILWIILILFPLKVWSVEGYNIIIKDHKFIPEVISIPAGKKIKLIIDNQDDEVEEFESFELRREKIIPAKGKIIINIPPLDLGEYKFFGDFHKETAQGIIKVE